MSNASEYILDRAVYVAREYYPSRITSLGHTMREVFALRYFDAAQEEVGYFLPDQGSWFEFTVPRIWSEENLQNINLLPVREIVEQ